MTSYTSVLAVKSDSYVILAAEGRIGTTRYGRVTSLTTSKVNELQKRVAMGFSGDLALPVIVEVRLAEEYKNKEAYADEVAKMVYELTRSFVEETDTMNSVIVGGVGRDGSYQMFLIETKERFKKRKKLKEVTHREIEKNYISVGSGSKTMDKFMKEKNVGENMPKEQAIELMMSALKKAIGKDWGSGGRLKAIVIKSDVTQFLVYHEDQEDRSYYLMDYKKASIFP